ncbi:DUF3566 domain-containing protein [Gordonia phosphorivorans]|uniref:DUF3566 domain-containing protein n=1 Tax=Gordonia phosphorivorans TaxID=1056982 RepID=A0ABV6HB47_9ACTN
MTKGNQPEDSVSERGAVPPPWKRGETTTATGLTSGDVAKAAAASTDQPPAPLGPTAGTPSGAPTRAVPAMGPDAPQRRQPEGPRPSSNAPGPQGPPASGGPAGPAPAGKAPAPSNPAAGNAGPNTAPPTSPGPSTGPSAPVAGPPAPKDTPAPAAADAAKTESAERAPAERVAARRIPAAATIGTPMRAAVQVRRVDPWSIFKVTGVLAVAGFLIWMIAIAVLYGVLAGMGVWDQINGSFGTLVSADGTSDNASLISSGQVFGFSALFGVFAAIVMTALATILAYIYNVCADVVGGFEITLADLD